MVAKNKTVNPDFIILRQKLSVTIVAGDRGAGTGF
jgi:hypothetical protein